MLLKCTTAPLSLRELGLNITLSAHSYTLECCSLDSDQNPLNKVLCTLRDTSFLRMYHMYTTGVYTLCYEQLSKCMWMRTCVLSECTANTPLLLHSVYVIIFEPRLRFLSFWSTWMEFFYFLFRTNDRNTFVNI